MKRLFKPVVIVLCTFALQAFAHGKDGVHLKGTVVAIDETSLTVKTTEGKQRVVHIDEETKFERGSDEVDRNSATPGERVVVHAMKMKDAKLHGHLVKLPKLARPPAPRPLSPPAPDAGR